MTSPLYDILESKRALRRELASLPIAEKLRMLDTMRERETMIRFRHNSDENERTPTSATDATCQ
jgi:hypothetical protein